MDLKISVGTNNYFELDIKYGNGESCVTTIEKEGTNIQSGIVGEVRLMEGVDGIFGGFETYRQVGSMTSSDVITEKGCDSTCMGGASDSWCMVASDSCIPEFLYVEDRASECIGVTSCHLVLSRALDSPPTISSCSDILDSPTLTLLPSATCSYDSTTLTVTVILNLVTPTLSATQSICLDPTKTTPQIESTYNCYIIPIVTTHQTTSRFTNRFSFTFDYDFPTDITDCAQIVYSGLAYLGTSPICSTTTTVDVHNVLHITADMQGSSLTGNEFCIQHLYFTSVCLIPAYGIPYLTGTRTPDIDIWDVGDVNKYTITLHSGDSPTISEITWVQETGDLASFPQNNVELTLSGNTLSIGEEYRFSVSMTFTDATWLTLPYSFTQHRL